jgi:hypothetical protein
VADQRPVVQPSVAEEPRASHAGTWLLAGGLLLGIGGIVAMLSRRRREDSISILDHELPPVAPRPPVLTQRSRTTEGLS